MVKIMLQKEWFNLAKMSFLENDEFSIHLFRYSTGICAVEMKNSVGGIIVLPYNGQMVWDAWFHGESIRAQTLFGEPREVDNFQDSYGCYLMHCGPRRIGSDSAHIYPLHGELPTARYDSAWILLGEDENGKYISISGSYEFHSEFNARAGHYRAVPECRLYAGSGVLKVCMDVTNLSNYPMEYMYLFHVNNRARPNGRFVQSCKCSSDNLKLLRPEPHDDMPRESIALREELIHRIKEGAAVMKDAVYSPEFVVKFSNLVLDELGFYHFMQIAPEGGADYTGIRENPVIRYFERWWTRTKDRSVLSLASPSTCRTNGYEIQKAEGNVLMVLPEETITGEIWVGHLNHEEAEELEQKLMRLLERHSFVKEI